MSADVTAAAAVVLALVALVLVGVTVTLRRQLRVLTVAVAELRGETVPLVHEARRVVDQASDEMERVNLVLEGTEAVTAAVDQASRLAVRTFSNPVVKVLAFRAGTVSGLRRLRSGDRSGRSGRGGRGAGSARGVHRRRPPAPAGRRSRGSRRRGAVAR